MARDIRRTGVPQITSVYLRNRAAHYRQLMTMTDDCLSAKRYRDLSELLDKEAEALERALGVARRC